MLFQYKALLNNAPIKGQLEAESQKEVMDYLKSNGYFILEIKEIKTSQLNFFSSFLQRVSFNDITYMTRQLAIMLNAGLTIIDSIEILKKQSTKPVFRDLLGDIDKSIREGKNFSAALAKYPKYFSTFFIALIKSGEASGKLDSILAKLAENLEFQRSFRSKIKNALIYPVVIIFAMVAMIFVIMTFVVPRLTELYESMEVELSASTQFLIAVSSFLENYWVFVIIGAIALGIGFQRLLKSESGKKFFDTYILYVPVFGKIIITAALVDATKTMSILIGSGVPILDALEIVTEVNTNIVFKNAFIRIKERVEKGLSIGTAMSNEKIFPESLVQMTIVGEQTGHLDETLDKISNYYQQETELAVKAMLTLIEPMILIVLGVTVGFVVMAVITPIFSLTSSLQ
ncbi:MAG TPA: type II secretion system F family protein [Candidatus Woesebacteria bacterium]|nr:type II secretion system F family protein [Candidatus Woesebacteria bacterium]